MYQLQINHELDPQAVLRIYCLGGFGIYKPGEHVALGIISKHKMWTLLKYLLANRQTYVPTATIIENLWPEQKNPRATSALKTTISRLKSILESNRLPGKTNTIIKYGKDTCALNSAYPFWLDIDEFERLCALAHRQGLYNRHEAVFSYLQALELYKGDFLIEDSDLEWTVIPREYYRRLFLDSVRELTKWLMEEGDFIQARRFLEQAVRIDPYAEDLENMLIRVLYETGNLQEAKAQYSNFSTLLYTELGVRPSTELKQIYSLIKLKELNQDPTSSILNGCFQRPDHLNGPLVCDSDLFMSFIELEQRRVARGSEACLITIEAERNKERIRSDDPTLIKKLEQLVCQILRKSDIVCALDEVHLVLLLPDTSPSGGRMVISNIIAKYSEEYGNPNPVLQFKCQEFTSF